MSAAADLAGQVAFLTGAAHGQGRAAALALACEGVRIAALDLARPLAYAATRWAHPASSRP
jgi:NAD(P)-dependent dehydrogenase (short-subunit alcohol dehydrogenase family)